MEGAKLWESLMNYLVMWFIEVALANIWLLLVLFSDDGPSPFGYLKDGEFLDLLITVVDVLHSCASLSITSDCWCLSILVWLFSQWRQSHARKATSRLIQNVNQCLCQNDPLPSNPLPKGMGLLEKKNKWEYSKPNVLLNIFLSFSRLILAEIDFHGDLLVARHRATQESSSSTINQGLIPGLGSLRRRPWPCTHIPTLTRDEFLPEKWLIEWWKKDKWCCSSKELLLCSSFLNTSLTLDENRKNISL